MVQYEMTIHFCFLPQSLGFFRAFVNLHLFDMWTWGLEVGFFIRVADMEVVICSTLNILPTILKI